MYIYIDLRCGSFIRSCLSLYHPHLTTWRRTASYPYHRSGTISKEKETKGNEGQRTKLPLERKWTWPWCHVSVSTGYHEPCCYLSPFLWVLSAVLKLSIKLFFFKKSPQVEPSVLSKQWKQTWRYNVFWLDCRLCLNQAFFFERKSEMVSFILCTSHYLP